MSSLHHQFSRLKGFGWHIGLEALCTAPTEGWNEIAREARTEDIGRYTNHSSCIEHGIDAAFAVVAHKEATKLQTSFLKTLGLVIPQFHNLVIVFQIAVVGIGTKIAPFTQNRIA